MGCLYGLGTRRPRRVKSWGPYVRLSSRGPWAAGPPELVSSATFPTSNSVKGAGREMERRWSAVEAQ